MSGKYQESIQICWKRDNKHHYEYILDETMISTYEEFSENSPMLPSPSVTVKNPSAIKSIRIFTEVFDVKRKNSVCWLGASK